MSKRTQKAQTPQPHPTSPGLGVTGKFQPPAVELEVEAGLEDEQEAQS